ncbi:MAG: hypothetical protein HY238_16920 [Acidobacteria bacterium]|nr:hypothetical protein [Acidobacteriota bacterium]
MPPLGGTDLPGRAFAVLATRIATCLLLAHALHAQGVIQTIAGTDWIFPSNGQPAVNAALGPLPPEPVPGTQGLAFDSRGNLYIADPSNQMVFRVDRDGILTVVAGNGIRGNSGDEGPATSASLFDPIGVAADTQGNIYIVEGNRVRRVSPDGIIRLFAGQSGNGPSGDGGPALAARFNLPTGVAVDATGNLYISEWVGSRVRKIDTKGIITTVAGNGISGFSGDGGRATAASITAAMGVAVDAAGNLYIADRFNTRIRRVSPDGIISTFAGSGAGGPPGASGDGGLATAASIGDVRGVTVDAAGNIYFASTFNRVWRVDSQGIIRVVAGGGSAGFAGDGGPATRASLSRPTGVVVDSAGNLYIADSDNARVRRVSPNGVITTFAGDGSYRLSADGTSAVESYLFGPRSVVVDAAGNVLIADPVDLRVRRLAPDGTLTIIAGNGGRAPVGDGRPAKLSGLEPDKVIVDPAGNVLILDTGPGRIHRLGPDGTLSIIAGGGADDRDGIPARQAKLNYALGMATDAAGVLYIAEANANRVRRAGLDGIITTVAGTGTRGFSGDGGPAANATLNRPVDVALDAAGNLYILDQGNQRIRRVSPDGVITTFAAGHFAQLSQAAVDAAGNLFVADTAGGAVFSVSPAGVVRTVAGQAGGLGFSGDGGPPLAAVFNRPEGVAVDSAGRIYIADTGNGRIRRIDIARPSFQLSTPTLSFAMRSNGAAPPPQNIDVTGTVGLALTVTATTASGGSWLTATPAIAATPARVLISVNQAGLAAGAYQGVVTVTAPDASPPTQTVTVQLTVDPPAPPVAAVAPAGLTFSFLQGASASSRQLRVANVGSGSLAFSISATTVTGGSWLTVTPAAGTATPISPAVLTITANPERLAAGTYTGRVTITPAGLDRIEIPVTITVTATPQRILLSQTGFTFTAVAGGGAPLPQTFVVLNPGSGVLNWTATASTLAGGAGWLNISAQSGVSDATSVPPPVEVRIDPTGLAPGEYYGQIEVRGVAANSPQSVLVVLNVLRADQSPGPVVQPTGFVFTGVAGGTSPGSQTLLVSNLTSRPLSFNSSQVTLTGGNWFVRVPPNGSLRPEQPFRILIQPDTTGLAAGVYSGVLTLLFEDRSVRSVNLLLVLAPSVGSSRSVQQSLGCSPTRLLPLFTSLGQDFNVAAAWPVPIEARIVDDCGAPLTSGIAVTTFSNGDSPLLLTSLRDGRWSGTWAPRGVRTLQTTVTLNAETPPSLRGVVTVTGSLRPNANPPLVAPGGVVSAASFERQGPVAPGSIVAIFGTHLSDGVSLADRLPLDSQRMGTQVILAGRPLPLYYTSDGQLNAMVPYALEVNTSHQLIVRRGNTLSLPEAVTVAAARPAVFTVNGAGTGQGHIYRAGPSGEQILADARNPVRAGDVVVIYCAGLGAVDPAVEAGQPAPRAPLSQTANAVSLSVGGREARLLYAGLAPDFTGLYQINAVVPEGVTPGDQAPVVLTVAGQPSPPVTIAVR